MYGGDLMICQKCNKEFPRRIKINGLVRDLSSRKFCLDCSPFNFHNTSKIVRKTKVCPQCNKELDNRQKIFCSIDCQNEYHYQDYIKRWKMGLEDGMRGQYGISERIKRYLFEKFNNKCSCCGWSEVNPFTNKIPLEVHHKDGDYTNNDEDNLDLLCPNCHSLTNTYKNGNSNGRKMRSKYS